MIFEHEIPAGSRLYFGESARLKRRIENRAAAFLEGRGYEEMVTPLFSYHQHESFDDPKELIRLNDESNHAVSLRADSTADVVRIATKRLGRSTDSKRWFYIQPVYTYPTREHYQIGVEDLEGDFRRVLEDAIALLQTLQLQPLLQVADIAIPRLLFERYGIDPEALKAMRLEVLEGSGHDWIARLVRLSRPEELEDLSGFPADVAEELRKMAEAVRSLDYPRIVVTPLYYARLRYYDALTFRLFEGNTLYATGGQYAIGVTRAAGFAVHTDACVATIMQKVNDVE
ncbi:ATP phosphoribosyltransferase regulatory subunit [Nitratifractor sp.]